MRGSLLAASMLGALIVVGTSGRLYADAISLNNSGANQSALSISADDFSEQLPTGTQTYNVNSLPASPSGSEMVGTSTSGGSATLTTSDFDLSFSGSLSDPGMISGQAEIFFKAGVGVSYSLSGSLTSMGSNYLSELQVTITDLTQGGATVYDFDQSIFNDGESSASTTITLDDHNSDASTTGFLAAALTAGDTYEFFASESQNNAADPSLMGGVNLSFSQPSVAGTPLPGTLPASAVLIALAGAVELRRRKAAV